MNLDVVRQVHRVKMLHANRAEQEQRARKAALEAALAAAESARRELAGWREEMPRRQAAIYDAIIGKAVALDELEVCKARVADLREHERLLEARLAEAEQAARAAAEALDAAVARLDHARRAVTKFEDVVAALRRLAALESERKEDAELEEAAEVGYRSGNAADGEEDGDGWDQAA